MEHCWITDTVVELGAECRRWLANKNDDPSVPAAKEIGRFLESDDGVLVMHMRQRLYTLEVLEVSFQCLKFAVHLSSHFESLG